MNKDYKKAIISIIVLAVVAIGAFWFFNNNTSQIEKDISFFIQENELTDDQRQKLDQAINVLKNDENNIEALLSLARVKYQTEDLKGSEDVYLKILEIQFNHTIALNNLGSIYARNEDWTKAEEMYLKLINATPKWISAYRELMSIYRYHLPEKYNDMEQILLTAIEVTSDLTEYAAPDLYLMLASFYERVGNIDQAIKYFEISLKVMPSNDAARAKLEILKNSN